MTPLTIVAIAALALVAYTAHSSSKERAADRDLLITALGSLGQVTTSAATDTAKAIGDAVQVALSPPPVVETTDDVMKRITHDLAEQFSVEDVDDSDPTDLIIGVERREAEMVDFTGSAPFGVPGLVFDHVSAANIASGVSGLNGGDLNGAN